ncbi:MAG: NADH-quinone oxidoreductase subunit NuoK [Deltaproteobacteria bacterium]|nr:NADH-quinone oxidoreductase subunit NuoK [Deltaproteobacteria bacterium]
MIPISYYLTLAAVMFTIGVVGVIVRRNAIVAFMCIELMLNAVNVTFVALSRSVGNLDGQIAVFFVMVVAAAEAAVGLAIIISVFRASKSVETTDSAQMNG